MAGKQVPRPLFVEEFGLKRLMETRGTCLSMSRADFEAGRWASLVLQAYEMGKEKKKNHRREWVEREKNGVHEESAGEVIVRELEGWLAG